MQKHLLALDLDGTTVNSAGKMGDKTKQALQKARKAGNIVCFATGRREIDMFSFKDADQYADYLLLNNGGKCIRTSDNIVLFNNCIDTASAKVLIQKCLLTGWQLHIISGMYWAVNCWSQGLHTYTQWLGTKPLMYKSIDDLPINSIEGMMATNNSNDICQYIKSNNLPLSYVQSEDNCTDIMAKSINKWQGLKKLSTALHIETQQIVAAGDYHNDIEMLQNAGIAVAVANALQEVKYVADFVTNADNNHDAVAEIVQRFLPL